MGRHSNGDAAPCVVICKSWGYRRDGIGGKMDYLVVDLETGEKRHTDAAPDLSRGICRTKELRLRRIPKGTFTMGTLVENREKN